MQPDSSHDTAGAGGKQVVLPSAASSGGFVQMRTAPVPCPTHHWCYAQLTAETAEPAAPAGDDGEADHAR